MSFSHHIEQNPLFCLQKRCIVGKDLKVQNVEVFDDNFSFSVNNFQLIFASISKKIWSPFFKIRIAENVDVAGTVRFAVRRDENERNERKVLPLRSDGRAEREAREDAKYSKRRNEEDKRARRATCARFDLFLFCLFIA